MEPDMTHGRARAGAFLTASILLLLCAGLYYRVAEPSLTFFMETGDARTADHDHPPLAQDDAEQLGRAMARLEKNPDDADLMLHIAEIFIRNKDWRNAVSFLERAALLAPADMRPPYFLGLALSGGGEYARAEKAFLKALEASPGNPQSMFNLAVLYRYHLGEPEKAAELFAAVAASPASDAPLRDGARRELAQEK